MIADLTVKDPRDTFEFVKLHNSAVIHKGGVPCDQQQLTKEQRYKLD